MLTFNHNQVLHYNLSAPLSQKSVKVYLLSTLYFVTSYVLHFALGQSLSIVCVVFLDGWPCRACGLRSFSFDSLKQTMCNSSLPHHFKYRNFDLPKIIQCRQWQCNVNNPDRCDHHFNRACLEVQVPSRRGFHPIRGLRSKMLPCLSGLDAWIDFKDEWMSFLLIGIATHSNLLSGCIQCVQSLMTKCLEILS